MATATITRPTINDDTGDGLSGDILNAAFFGSKVYDAIDAMFAGNLQNLLCTLLDVSNTDAGIRLFTTRNPGNTTDESYIAGFGYDANGNQIKQWSLSTIFVSTSAAASTGYSCSRLNTGYRDSGGTQVDDLWLRGWGNRGAAFFAASSGAADAPGRHRLKVRGAVAVGDFDNDTGVGVLFAHKPTVTGGAGATAIASNKGSEGSLVVVAGQFSNKRFTDLVLFSASGTTATVIGSATDLNTPATRTYAVSGAALTLSLTGTDAYTVRVTGLGSDENF